MTLGSFFKVQWVFVPKQGTTWNEEWWKPKNLHTHTQRGAVESLVLINLSWYIVVIFPLWGLLEIFVTASLIMQKTGVNEIWCVPVSLSVNCSLVKLTFFGTKQSWILRTFSFQPEIEAKPHEYACDSTRNQDGEKIRYFIEPRWISSFV